MQTKAKQYRETIAWLGLGLVFGILAIPQIHMALLNSIAPSPYWNQFAGGLVYSLGFYAIFCWVAGVINQNPNWSQGSVLNSLASFVRDAAHQAWMASRLMVSQAFQHGFAWYWLPPLLVAIGLRLPYINQSMRYDEAYTVNQYIDQSIVYFLRYSDPNNHVLHTICVKAVTLLLGYQEWVIRIPAFMAGIISVPLVIWLSSRIRGAPTSLAGWLLAVWPQHILYCVNARGYTLQSLLVVMLVAIAILKFNEFSRWRVLFVVICSLAVLTMPTSLLPISGLLLFFVWHRFQFGGDTLVRCVSLGTQLGLMIVILSAVLYSPVVAASNGPQAILANPFVKPLPMLLFLQAIPAHASSTAQLLSLDLIRPLQGLLILAGILVLLLVFARGRWGLERSERWSNYAYLLTSIACGSLLVLLLQRAIPFERNWFFLLPPVAVLLTWVWPKSLNVDGGLARMIWSRVWFVCLLVQAFVLMVDKPLSRYFQFGEFADAKEVARYLADHGIQRSQIDVSVPEGAPLDFYLRRFSVQSQEAGLAAGPQEYFVVDRKVRDIEHLTKAPVERIARFGTAEVYRLAK